MNLPNFKKWIFGQIVVKKGLENVAFFYLLLLVSTSRKKSQEQASRFFGLHKSQFGRFLANHAGLAIDNLNTLSKKQAKQFSKALEQLANGALPWKIAILIDSTLQNRSGRHTDNAQRFNHGSGFVIGHQWTNIVLLINGTVIPLPPIPFQTKKYCKTNKLKYQTEHALVVKYIEKLDLKEFIGTHNPNDVLVLADSGYDCRDIENAIIKKEWKFIIALKKCRSVKSEREYKITKKSTGWNPVGTFFKTHLKPRWITVRFTTNGTKKRRMDFRTRRIVGYLRYVGDVQLVCSEFKKRSKGRRKYLACNDLKVTPRQILLGYRLRWSIEIFHKDIKQYLGFQDVATTTFEAVSAHVHWVYCAYILLNLGPPGMMVDESATIRERQLKLEEMSKAKEVSKWRQILTQFNGQEKLLNEFFQVLQNVNCSLPLCS